MLEIIARKLPLSIKRLVWTVMASRRFGDVIDRFTKLDREFVANRYIRGEGIEIGALMEPLKAPQTARVKYLDRMTVPELRKQYPELESQELVNTDIIDNGETLETIHNGTQDFVIANHFLEHCQDPISTIEHMLRVLRDDGIIYLAVPDKRYTFDVDRPVTPLAHLLEDYEKGPAWSRRGHFEEFARHVNKCTSEDEIESSVSHMMNIDYSIHFHVWTQAEMLEFIAFLKTRLKFTFELEMFFRNSSRGECIFILRKNGLSSL
jgi:SAM-dependent methyltransferase